MADEPTTTPEPADDTNNETTPPTPTPTPTPAPAKNDPGKADKGDEMPPELKTIVDKERRLARDADKRARAAEAELDKFRTAQLTEHEKAVKAAREEGHTEGVSKGNKQLLRAEVLAAASGKAADPADVYAILSSAGSLNDFDVNENGEIDSAALKTVVDDLIKAKPHLAASRAPEFGARPSSLPAGNSDAGMDAWIRGQTGRI